MAQHNLSTVVGFEFLRTVRKRGFRIAVLAVPMIIAIVFALSSTSNSPISDSSEAQAEAELAFAYTDAPERSRKSWPPPTAGNPSPTPLR